MPREVPLLLFYLDLTPPWLCCPAVALSFQRRLPALPFDLCASRAVILLGRLFCSNSQVLPLPWHCFRCQSTLVPPRCHLGHVTEPAFQTTPSAYTLILVAEFPLVFWSTVLSICTLSFAQLFNPSLYLLQTLVRTYLPAHAITRAVTHIYLLTLIQSHTQTQEPGGRPLAQVASVPERPSRSLSSFIYYSNLEASSGLNGTIIKCTLKLRLLVVP